MQGGRRRQTRVPVPTAPSSQTGAVAQLYRLPYRLRAAAQREMEKGMLAASASASAASPSSLTNHRRKRRRPASALASHAHRQCLHSWQETHIWHAKRFHLLNAWGWRLPDCPTDKSWRALHKAALHLCTVSDVSHISCISLTGREADIASVLGRMTGGAAEAAGGVLNELYRGGEREGRLLLHQPDAQPFGLIAPAQFMWRPPAVSSADAERKEAEDRELWLWAHPAVYEELMQVLTALGGQYGCGVESLRGQLCRLELTGARCQQVLAKVLQPSATTEAAGGGEDGTAVWKLLCESGLRTPSSLPASVALGVTAVHPATLKGRQRLQQPFVSTASSSYSPGVRCLSCFLSSFCRPAAAAEPLAIVSVPQSPLGCRGEAACDSQHGLGTEEGPIFCAAQEKQPAVAAPPAEDGKQEKIARASTSAGSRQTADDLSLPLPLLLIQRPSPSSLSSQQHARGLFSGWDVVLPAGLSLVVFRALVAAGARAEGLQQRHHRLTKCGAPCFPHDFPDSLAGFMQARWRGEKERAAWLRHPPNRRVNWEKARVSCPYQPDWSRLLSGTTQQDGAVVAVQRGEMKKVDGAAKGWEAVKGSEAAGEVVVSGEAGQRKPEAAEAAQRSEEQKEETEEDASDAAAQKRRRTDIAASEQKEEARDSASVSDGAEMEDDEEKNAELVHHELEQSVVADISATTAAATASDAASLSSAASAGSAAIILPYYVLRDWRQQLQSAQSSSSPVDSPFSFLSLPAFASALLAVSLSPLQRGVLSYNAMITLPTADVLLALLRPPASSSSSSSSALSSSSFSSPSSSSAFLHHHTKSGAWCGVDAPLSAAAADDHADCIGHVTSGEYSFLQGEGSGVGFVTAHGLSRAMELIRQSAPHQLHGSYDCIVLVRNVTSRTYRPARLSLI